MRRMAILVALVLFLLAGVALAANPYELLWYSIGGSAESEGGMYTLASTAGQPAAGALSGGQYSLVGGFWSGVPPRYPVYLPVVLR